MTEVDISAVRVVSLMAIAVLESVEDVEAVVVVELEHSLFLIRVAIVFSRICRRVFQELGGQKPVVDNLVIKGFSWV